MSNNTKIKKIFESATQNLDSFARGYPRENLGPTLEKLYRHLINECAFIPNSITAETDYAKEFLNTVKDYSRLITLQKQVDVGGSLRRISTETEAFSTLELATNLALKMSDMPLSENSFSNCVFNSIYNLSLAYVDSISGGVANEYIPSEDSYSSKCKAVEIAKRGVRTRCSYLDTRGLLKDNKKLESKIKLLESSIKDTRRGLLRSFENVPVQPKKVYHKQYAIDKVLDELSLDVYSEKKFVPQFVFPIATGGTELGILISNQYEDMSYNVIAYPLMFSMKTRKQKYPWVINDAPFLTKSLEGKNVLIVEDWVTTGNTLRGIIQKIEAIFPREIRVATIKRDPEKSNIPILDRYHFYVGDLAVYSGDKTDSLKDTFNLD